MTSLSVWSPPTLPWLGVLLLLGMLLVVALLVVGLDPTAHGEIGSWRWGRLPHLG